MTNQHPTPRHPGEAAASFPIGRLGLFVILITGLMGAISLTGWLFDQNTLKAVIPGWAAMKANTALGFCICSIALLLSGGSKSSGWSHRISQVLAFLIMALGLVTVSQDIFNWDLRIDEALFQDSSVTVQSTEPGRMVPTAAFCFAVFGMAVILANETSHRTFRFRLSVLKACAVTLILAGLITLLGFLEKSSSVAEGSKYTGMALLPGICFFLNGIGFLNHARREDRLHWYLDWPATCGMVLGVGFMLLMVKTSYTRINELRQNESKVARCYTIVSSVREIEREVASLGNSTRAYQVTGEAFYLHEHAASAAFIQRALEKCRELTRDHPIHQQRLDEITSVLPEYLAAQEKLIDARRSGILPAPTINPELNETLPLRIQLGNLLQQIESAEFQSVEADKRQAERSASVVFLLLPIECILSIGLLFASAFSLNSSLSERLKKEKQLKDSLKQSRDLRDALDQHAIVSTTNEKGEIIEVNEKFLEVTKYPIEELLGKQLIMLNSGHHPDEFFDEIASTIQSGRIWKGDIKNKAKDGSFHWVRATMVPFIGEDGVPRQFIAIRTDITEMKKLEEQLEQERSLLLTIIDAIPDLIFIKDTSSTFLSCNKAFAEYGGTTKEQVIRTNGHRHITGEQMKSYQEADLRLFESGRQQRNEEWIPRYDGLEGYFETLKSPLFGPDGECQGLVAISRDITERKISAEKMRGLVERLQIVVRSSQVGIWELDLITGRATWDEKMSEIHGETSPYPEEGVQRWTNIIHPDDIQNCRQVLKNSIKQNKEYFDFEYRINRPDTGEIATIRSMGMIQRNDAGKAIRMIGSNRDVTEERRREEKLANALVHEKELSEKARAGEKAKSEFLAVMSHELRTPMNGILGFAHILCEEQDLSEASREHAQTILQSSEALLRILDDILEFSRLEAGRIDLERASFPPRTMIADIHKLFAPRASQKNIDLEITVEDDVPEFLEGDAGRIRQILLNLLGNAIKFTDYGWVGIHLGKNERGITFRVKDTGPGIPKNKLESIFQPFTQADSSISRSHGGTGLGLTITRSLVELMGGSLTATSEIGVGSEFVVSLPLQEPSRMLPLQSATFAQTFTSQFAEQYPLRLLVVEDDPVNLKLIQTLIRRLGYAPLSAGNGKEAVELYRIQRPDCILMDLQMPEMDGLEATRRIRTFETESGLSHRSYICALTADIFPEDRQRCMEAGMNAFMNKPFKPTALAEILLLAHESRAALAG